MSKRSKAGRDNESSGLLLFISRKRVPLVAVTLLAIIVSVIVSLFITDRYRSNVILYPAASVSLSRSLMGPTGSRGEMGFGQEADAERLLQILRSDAIREKIINKYSLMEHYGIREGSRFPQTALDRKFNSNVRFRKTEYGAVEIEVLDTDPEMAAAIANDIAACIDSVVYNMLRTRTGKSLDIVGDEYRRLRQEVDLLEDSLRKIRQSGVIDYESQAEVLNNAWASAILNKDTTGINFFRGRINTLSVWGGAYVRLRNELVFRNDKLSNLQSAYDELRLNAGEIMPYKYIVNEARVAEKKSYPVRSLIVGVSAISAFLFALFTLLLADAFRSQVITSKKSPKKKPLKES